MNELRRYVVLGAGAIGCAIGGLLQLSGAAVVFVARGAQLSALRDRGLHLVTPSRDERLDVQVVGSPAALQLGGGDVVLLCTKSQDTAAALGALAACAPAYLPIFCAQNGVANERLAAAKLDSVYGLLVFAPVSFLEPGRVAIHSEPAAGGLDIGVYPEGVDEQVLRVARDLAAAGFDARAEPRILRLKHGKLLTNLANALQALAGAAALTGEFIDPLRDEALACYRAAGIDFAPVTEIYGRNANIADLPVQGHARRGGSSWQSLARRSGSIETDSLNGEIVRLGERFGVPVPMNRALVELARRAAAELWTPERLSLDELRAALAHGSEPMS